MAKILTFRLSKKIADAIDEIVIEEHSNKNWVPIIKNRSEFIRMAIIRTISCYHRKYTKSFKK